MDSSISILPMNRFFKEDYDKSKYLQRDYRNKIVSYSPYLVNEVNICHKIIQIPYYSNYFSVLEHYEKLNISQFHEDIIDELPDIYKNQYYLLQYDDKESHDLTDLLYNSKSIKKLIHDMICSFQHILQSLIVLNDNELCYFHISPENFLFLKNYREKPVLSRFSLSLQINQLDFYYISNMLSKIDNFTYLPPELHLLFYFMKQDIQTVSYSFIEEFSENFLENLPILRLFSGEYQTAYKHHCINSLKPYMNASKEQIISDILERNNKWDVYGISVLFLQIFGCIFRVFSLKGTFIGEIVKSLSRNLHPDSSKRLTLRETLNMFHKCLDSQTDWDFINNMDNHRLPQLFDELQR